jgi:PD-(D/E)XK nuclease superfamily protein
MADIIWLYDRSRVVADWKCPRSRYWGYHYGGKGVTSGGIHLELYLGSALHDGLAAIAQTHPLVDIDLIASTAQQQVVEALDGESPEEADFAMEQSTLIEGLLRGFYRHVWPTLLKGGKVVACEKEVTYQHNGLTFMAKPDLIIEDSEGNYWYVEYKSTSFKKDGWVNSWDTAVQLHSSIKAVEQTLGIKVAGVIVQGLYKGYESYGKQSSPFCYGYQRGATPPFTRGEIRYDYAPGFRRTPTWEMESGVRGWVANMPIDVLSGQFPTSPPIFIKDHLIENFFWQRTIREMEIKNAVGLVQQGGESEQLLGTFFPQHFDQCVPAIGKPCQFRQLCHGLGNGNPLDHGYTWREPHHIPEKEAWDAK